MRIEEILSGVEILRVFTGRDTDRETEIAGVSCDSREIGPGWIFVANRGKIQNGEDFASEAVRKGAVAVVAEERLSDRFPSLEGVCQIVVPSTRNALSIMAANWMGRPAERLKMIGITGSNGKTSTAFMVDGILRAAGIPAGLLGTVYARTGKRVVASILTTPDSSALQQYLRDMVDSGFQVCTMEVSSIAVNMRRVHGVSYDVFAFTNISREHIDDHGDFETYYGLKASVVRGLSEDAVCVLNADQELVSRLAKETKAKVYTFSHADKNAYCHLESLDLSTGRAVFTMRLGEESLDIRLGVAGYHNVINALVAATIAKSISSETLPITAEHIRLGLEAYKGVERRFECIYDRKFKIFDDHFANPGNIDVTFETMHQMKYRAFQMCYAVRGSRGVTVNRENVEAMMPHLRKLGVTSIVATASVETVNSKDVVTPEEKAVFLSCMEREGIDVIWCERLSEAVQAAVDRLQEGDVLLLAGCQGMDSGGHIALHHLYRKTGDASILQPLSERVCGSLPAEELSPSERKCAALSEKNLAPETLVPKAAFSPEAFPTEDSASEQCFTKGLSTEEDFTISSIELDKDFDSYLELCKRSFGEGVKARKDMYDWYFNRNPYNPVDASCLGAPPRKVRSFDPNVQSHPDKSASRTGSDEGSPASRNLMYVMKSGDKVIAADGLFPFELQLHGKTYRAAHSVQSMTHPDYKGRGLFRRMTENSLTQAKRSGIDIVLGFANKNSYGAYEKFGWHTLFERHVHIRPVHIYTRLRRKLKLAFFAGLGAALFSLYDAVRRFALRKRSGSYTAEVLDSIPPAVTACFERHRLHYDALIVRDYAYLHYRYDQRPDVKYKTLVIRRNTPESRSQDTPEQIGGGEIDGFAVMRLCPIGDHSMVTVTEFFCDPNEPEAANALIGGLMDYAYASVAEYMVVSVGGNEKLMHALRKAGFRINRKPLLNNMVIAHALNEEIDPQTLIGASHWMITQGDGETELHI